MFSELEKEGEKSSYCSCVCGLNLCCHDIREFAISMNDSQKGRCGRAIVKALILCSQLKESLNSPLRRWQWSCHL